MSDPYEQPLPEPTPSGCDCSERIADLEARLNSVFMDLLPPENSWFVTPTPARVASENTPTRTSSADEP